MWRWSLSALLILDLSRWFVLINRIWAEVQLPLLTRSYKTNQIVSSLRLFSLPCCCCSDVKSCLTLCDPMGCSTPGSPAFHYFLEYFLELCPVGQWHYLTISSSAALFSFAFSLCQHQGLFQWVGFSHQVAQVFSSLTLSTIQDTERRFPSIN